MTATMREISPGNVHMNYFRVLLQHLTQPSCVYTQTLISRLSYFRMQMASPTQVLPLQSNCSNCSSDWPDTGSPSACWGRHFWPGHTHKGTWKHQDHGLHTRDCITTLSTQIPAQPRLCRQSHEHQSSPYIIDTPCRFKCFERFPPLINSLSLLFPSISRDCDDSMMESLAAALRHSREQAQHTYDQRTANEKKAAGGAAATPSQVEVGQFVGLVAKGQPHAFWLRTSDTIHKAVLDVGRDPLPFDGSKPTGQEGSAPFSRDPLVKMDWNVR